jgi:hypothetical protein
LTPGKAGFADVYNQPDPREYFRKLGALEYQIPEHGCRAFRMLLAEMRRIQGDQEPISVADICCSYGINAALLNHRLDLADLYRRYRSAELRSLDRDELIDLDRRYFADVRIPTPVTVCGVDIAEKAIKYALDIGLMAEGFVEDLEASDPSEGLRASLAATQLITVTGGVGYITEKTFARVLDAVDGPVWVAAFVLRVVPYDPFVDVLAERGLATERYPATFPQRRFANEEEERYTLNDLERIGVDPTGKESTGYYHADLFVSRPAEEVAELPLERLMGRLSTSGLRFGDTNSKAQAA